MHYPLPSPWSIVSWNESSVVSCEKFDYELRSGDRSEKIGPVWKWDFFKLIKFTLGYFAFELFHGVLEFSGTPQNLQP